MRIFGTLALAWGVFFVFAPGFGSQYLVWLAPCFLMASECWYAALTLFSSVALFVFYNAISNGMPWYTGFTVHAIANVWTPWLLLPWLVLAAFLDLGETGWVENDEPPGPSAAHERMRVRGMTMGCARAPAGCL